MSRNDSAVTSSTRLFVSGYLLGIFKIFSRFVLESLVLTYKKPALDHSTSSWQASSGPEPVEGKPETIKKDLTGLEAGKIDHFLLIFSSSS